MRENEFQPGLIKKLNQMFEGCIITKLDANYIQGIPDLLILYNDRWAVLECKRSKNATHRPNQDYYVNKLNQMSYSAFIYPENEEVILNELQQALRPSGSTCVSESEPIAMAEVR